MTVEELLTALRRQEVMDSLRCLGCGYEHRCSIRGCAINRAAAETIEKLAAENEALRNPPNSPLTLDELRGMDGEPVWVELIGLKRPSAWYLLNLRDKEAVNKRGGFVSLINYGDTWLAYRRKPEEGTV